jgi:hypothetical protein
LVVIGVLVLVIHLHINNPTKIISNLRVVHVILLTETKNGPNNVLISGERTYNYICYMFRGLKLFQIICSNLREFVQGDF